MHDIADIACNFSSDRFDSDLDEVINRAISNNITKFGLICSRLGDLDKLLSIYNNYSDSMLFTIGIHPHHAKRYVRHVQANILEALEAHGGKQYYLTELSRLQEIPLLYHSSFRNGTANTVVEVEQRKDECMFYQFAYAIRFHQA